MASDTVPAAVPGPAEPPADHTTQPSGQPQPGGLAGLLAPLQPARSAAFSLPDIPTIDDALDPAAGTATSADFQNTDTPQNTTGKDTKNARQERGIVRAWLLAGAERWRKGGDARLKRLDIEKARAQAFKEARQIRETRTVNRAEKTGGGALNSSTGSSTKAGKQNNSKTSAGSTGAKNSTGGSGGGASRSGSRGGSGGGSSSGGAGRGGAHRPSGPTKTPSGGSAGSSGRGHGGSTSGTNTGGGKPTGKHHGPDKPAADRKASGGKTPSGNSGGSGGGGKAGPAGAPGKRGKDAPKPHNATKAKDTTGKTPTPASGTAPAATSAGSKASKDAPASPSGRSKVDLKKKPKSNSGKETKPTDPATKTDKTSAKTAPTPASAGGPHVNTQSSRETGYRDGTRAAKVIAHVEAWRDGARDGWTDTRKAAAHDKARLDKAHADQTARDKDQPMTQPASSTDYQPHTPPKPDHAPATGPQPIQVTGIDATHIHLGDGADRSTLSRGEVRTLKQFERRMRPKADVMTRIGDATKALKTEAEERAKKITQLAEQAKTIKGGDQLVAKLLKFQEQAQVQVQGAEELHKRALRAAEACTTVVTNADTRYGQIYKAVIDSDLTTPAELRFYTDKAS
ncbi:MAG TPA: hypothetical protein VFH70_04050 [Acidimicrobiales bacterium]|nr:hypothetical protein [Acidimicrobiales bacterium]